VIFSLFELTIESDSISVPVFEYQYSPAGVPAAKIPIVVFPDFTVSVPVSVWFTLIAPRIVLAVSPAKVVVAAVVIYLYVLRLCILIKLSDKIIRLSQPKYNGLRKRTIITQ